GAGAAAAILLAGISAFVVILEDKASLTAELDEVKLSEARLALDHKPYRSLEILAGLSKGFPRMSAARINARDALARGFPRLLAEPPDEGVVIAFSPDGRLLASDGKDGGVHLWEVGGAGSYRTLTGPRELRLIRFSPDGKRLAAVGLERDIW